MKCWFSILNLTGFREPRAEPGGDPHKNEGGGALGTFKRRYWKQPSLVSVSVVLEQVPLKGENEKIGSIHVHKASDLDVSTLEEFFSKFPTSTAILYRWKSSLQGDQAVPSPVII